MPKRDFIIDKFGSMNNVSDPKDIGDDAVLLEGLVSDIPGQLRTMGKESNLSKTFTGFQSIDAHGLFHTLVDRNRAGDEEETEWLLSPDKDTGIVGVLEYPSVGGAPGSGTFYSALSPTMDIGAANTKGVFHNFDGVTRGCDAGFGGTPKWYGYIKRNRFTGAAGAWTDDAWFVTDLLLPKPASLLLRSDGVGWDNGLGDHAIQIGLELENLAADDNYQFHKLFEGAVSYLYDNNQESLLTISSNRIDYTSTVASKMYIGLHITGDPTPDFATNFPKRITHVKYYMREVGTEEWYLQGVWDIDKGGSLPYSEKYYGWQHDNIGNKGYYGYNVNVVPAEAMPEPLMEHTYLTETSHSPSEKAIDIGKSGDGWKAAVILNRQVYLFGVKAFDKNGVQREQGDLILVSEPNQPDKFLRSNALISTTGDADHLVYGLGYNDALFAFKRNSTRIINVAQETYIDDTIMEGVDDVDKAVLTDYGVIWVNKNGLFLYGRNGFQELFKKRIEGKLKPYIDLDWFNTEVYGAGCGIAYNRYKQQIIISGYASGDEMIIYDLASGNVSYGVARITAISSNFVEDIAGNTLFLKDVVNDVHLYKFDFDSTILTASTSKYYTKDFDFGFPYVKKYIYKVIVNYKNSIGTDVGTVNMLETNDLVTYNLVGNFDVTSDFIDAIFVMPSSAVYVSGKSFKLQITSGPSTLFSINHIIIVYRILHNAR